MTRSRSPTPAGPRTFRIEGTYVDYVGSLDLGAVAISQPLLASIWGDRQIAMLRTIGVSARDVIRSVLIECAALGAIGGAWGVIVAGMLGVQFVVVSLHLITGWRIPFVVPTGAVVPSIVSARIVSTMAGCVPARAAGRLLLRQPASD